MDDGKNCERFVVMHMLYCLEPQPPREFFLQHKNLHPVLCSLLWQRNIRTKEEIDEFLNPEYRIDFYDPFKFQEMEKTIERLRMAAKAKERAIIYGDYDVDGVSSSILMLETLLRIYKITEKPKSELVTVYLPHREDEGYGLNPGAVSYIKSCGATLVIACDCGSGNAEELTALESSGIDVIILDHHVSPKNRPPCYGFINPKFERETYPFPFLAATGVVFKVIQALRLANEPLITEGFEKWSMDLVALATIADMMPLLKENRALVKWGLVVLNKTKRIGLRALIQAAGISKTITAYEAAFALSPRINAAGRLDHANVAFDLLRQNSPELALKEAMNLNKTNAARQVITDKITKEAKKQISEEPKEDDRILVAYNLVKNAWPTGVIGLVASRIAKEYHRPVFVIGLSNHGFSGSGRSIPGFDLNLSLQAASDILEKYGGHPQACGFTMKPGDDPKNAIALFKHRMEGYARAHMEESELAPETPISCELSFSDIEWSIAEDLIRMEPFGQGNPVPLFLTRDARVVSCRTMGKDNNHCRIVMEQNGVICEAVAFCAEDHVKQMSIGEIRDIIYELDINEWNGTKRIQLIVKDMLMPKG